MYKNYQYNPKEINLKAVKRLYRYIFAIETLGEYY